MQPWLRAAFILGCMFTAPIVFLTVGFGTGDWQLAKGASVAFGFPSFILLAGYGLSWA